MAEQTFNEALRGDEIIEAVCDRLRQKLRLDCYMNRNNAYDYFSATINIELHMHDAGVEVKTEATAEFFHDTTPRDQVEEVENVTAVLDISPEPPNVVREETGQPIPVLSTNAEGKAEIKRVQYARPSAKQAAKRAAARSTVLLMLIGGMACLHAQTAATPAPAALPPNNPAALTNTEKIAMEAVQKDAAAIAQQMRENETKQQAILEDLQRQHPGYRLNPQTMRLEPTGAQAGAVPPTHKPMPKFGEKPADAPAKAAESGKQK